MSRKIVPFFNNYEIPLRSTGRGRKPSLCRKLVPSHRRSLSNRAYKCDFTDSLPTMRKHLITKHVEDEIGKFFFGGFFFTFFSEINKSFP
jgi:hypothetical protein